MIVTEGLVEVVSLANPSNKRLVAAGESVIVRPNGDIGLNLPGPGGELNGRTRMASNALSPVEELAASYQRSIDNLVQNSIEAFPVLIRRPTDIPGSEITPHSVYLRRREFMMGIAGLAALAAVGTPAHAAPIAAQKSPFSTDETPTRHEDATTYNNFYEFGTAKTDPAAEAGSQEEGACGERGSNHSHGRPPGDGNATLCSGPARFSSVCRGAAITRGRATVVR